MADNKYIGYCLAAFGIAVMVMVFAIANMHTAPADPSTIHPTPYPNYSAAH